MKNSRKRFCGILVVRAKNEDAARAPGSADRSVKAGVNKTDVAEMRVAFVRVPRVKSGTEK